MARTHYDNLKIAETASSKEVQRAYRVLAQKWHPDKNIHQTEEAENYIKIINEAYRVLSDPELRQEHDAWIRDRENGNTTEHVQASDGRGSGYRGSEENQFRRKRKRSKQADQTFRVSKRKFTLSLIALFGIPAVLGAIFLNADAISGFISKVPVPVVVVNKPDSVTDGIDANNEIEKGLSEFFVATNRTLTLITDSDSAIAAVPRLKQSQSYIFNSEEQLQGSDRVTKSSVSKVTADGLRRLGPQIYRLQNEPRIWDILFPTLNPMMQTLKRMSEAAVK